MTIHTADDALGAVRATLAELADAEKRFEAGRARYRSLHPTVHPTDADRQANRTWPPVMDAITDWRTAHTRLQSYAAVATALLLAEQRPVPAWEGVAR